MITKKYTFEIIRFKDLKEAHFIFLDKLSKESSFNEKRIRDGYIFDKMDYRNCTNYQQNIGHVFFAKNNSKLIGFLLSFDSIEIKDNSFPIWHISSFLHHEWKFIEAIFLIGSFCFIDQFAVKKEYRKNGIGDTLVGELLSFASKNKVAIVASAIHQYNQLALKLLKKRGFFFTDFYPNTKTEEINWWFRVIKILHQKVFLKSINAQTLLVNSELVIPIQLNQTTRNINQLIRRLGAKIIWSSFFHYKNEMLSDVLGLRKNHNGYYDPILTCSPKNYKDVVDVLKESLTYLYKKDESSKVASLSKSFYRNGFEFFILNEAIENHSFATFTNPKVFNIDKLDVSTIFHKIKPTSDLKAPSKKNKKEWNNIVLRQQNEEYKDEWEKWVKRKWILDSEITELRLIGEKINKQQTLNDEEKSKWRKWTDRYLLTEENENKWEDWITFHKKLYASDQKSNFYVEGETIWCHTMIPMSFSGGLSGIMLSFLVKKTEEDQTLINDLAYTISNAFAKNIFNILLKLQNNVTFQYLHRFAIATIMARNLSHNLGSHVLSKASSPSIIAKYIFSRRRYKVEGIETVTGLNAYIQTRMDFIADIAISEPVTHFSRYLHKDVLHQFNNELFLLKHISSSDIKDIKVLPEVKTLDIEDAIVKIPNGNLGNHALYTILENMIRNITKHDHTHFKELNQLFLYINIKEESKESNFYKITIYDNIERGEEVFELVQSLNHQIGSPIFSKAHKIRTFGLGLLEMCISAAYLRGYLPSNVIGNKKLSPPLLKATEVPIPGSQKYHLGYELYLRKPKEIAWIKNTRISYLNSSSVQPIFVEEFLAKNKILPHSFLLLENTQIIENKKGLIPLRIIQINKDISINELNKGDFLIGLWQYWLEKLIIRKQIGRPNLSIHLSGQKGIKNRQVDENSLSNIILFDHHGERAKIKSDHPSAINPNHLLFYEAFNSITPLGHLLRDWDNYTGKEKQLLELQLVESALTKVIIIDERIQRECLDSDKMLDINGATYFEQLRWSNIIVPTPKCLNLNQRFFPPELAISVFSFISKKYKQEEVDFIVIHIGLLEKIFESNQRNINQFVQKLQKEFKEAVIVFITGRGKIANLPEGTHFLNYSAISNYLFESKSKFHLSRILFSTRTRLNNYE